MPTRSRAASAAALSLVCLLSACGSGDDDPTLVVPTGVTDAGASASSAPSEEPDFTSGDNAPDPCTLLTDADVSAAVGATVKPGEKTVDGPPLGGESCLWATSGVPVRTFQLAVKDGGDITVEGLTPTTLFEQSLTTLPGLTEVSGIGDRAALAGAQALVLKDGVYLLASVGFGASGTAEAALRTLTEKAAAAL